MTPDEIATCFVLVTFIAGIVIGLIETKDAWKLNGRMRVLYIWRRK
jgi:hypothetical protein